MTCDGRRLINASREARTLSPEAREAKEAREDRVSRRQAQMDRAQPVTAVAPRVEGETSGMVGDSDE